MNTSKKKYELIEHTADIGIRAFGNTLSHCFAHAAKGMFDIITNESQVESVGEYHVDLSADNIEQLLVDWLSELLFLHSTQRLVFGEFDVHVDEESPSLEAKVFGERYDDEKHGYGAEIKAVTYHMLDVEQTDEGYAAQVLFDI